MNPLPTTLPYYRAFQEKYNLLKKDTTITVDWNSMTEFKDDMYECYKELRDTHSKVSYTINGTIANKQTMTFMPKVGDPRVHSSRIAGTDYTAGVPVDTLHTFILATEFSQPHSNIIRRLKALQRTGKFGDTTTATIISGTIRNTKTVVQVLTIAQYSTLKTALTITASKRTPDYIYVIKYNNTYKIGMSSNVEGRFKKLVTSSPVPLTLVYSQYVGDAKQVEKSLHIKYKECNSHGEWFNLADTQVKEITTYLDNLKE